MTSVLRGEATGTADTVAKGCGVIGPLGYSSLILIGEYGSFCLLKESRTGEKRGEDLSLCISCSVA